MAGVLNDFMGGYNAVTQSVDGVRQAVDRGQLRKLAPRAIAGDPGAQVQAAAIDPAAAQQFGNQRDDLLTRARSSAQHLQAALKAGDPGAIAAARQYIKPFMDTLHPEKTPYPLDMDPAAELQGVEAFIAQTEGLERRGNEAVGRVIGNNLVDPRTGQVIYEGEDAPVNGQVIAVPDGNGGTVQMIFDPRTRQLSMPQYGGQQQEVPLVPMSGPNGSYNVGSDLTPEQLAIARADQNGGVADQVTLPTRDVAPAQFNQQSQGGPRLGYSPPKADEMTAYQREQLGLSRRAADRADQAANRAGQPGSGKPPTEGERKAATLLQRLRFSQQQLQQAVAENPEAASPNMASEVARELPFIGGIVSNTITPQERQRVEAAQLDILDAALTLGTGAAYTREQLEGYRQAYFPRQGDSPQTVADKARRLDNVIEAAKIAAGRAGPGAGAQDSPAAPRAPSALPPGFTWGD